MQISHLQGGVVAASEDNFVVDINTLHTFIVQFLLPYLGQSVEVPDLDRKFIPSFTGLVLAHLNTAIVEAAVNPLLVRLDTQHKTVAK